MKIGLKAKTKTKRKLKLNPDSISIGAIQDTLNYISDNTKWWHTRDAVKRLEELLEEEGWF